MRRGERSMGKRLGDILKEHHLASEEQIDQALRIQVGGNRRLGYLLLKMGVISADQLLKVLSQQMGLDIINVDQEFSTEVVDLLPRYLCRKYTVLPLRQEQKNILNVAMVDPSDDAAITDIETYTGMVVRPMLAREPDISAAIKRLIPFSYRDLVNPQVYGRAARLASLCLLALLAGSGWVAYRYVMHERYGTVSVSPDAVTYKNHDLMVGVEGSGKISLLGHGAYTKGFYSVTFPSVDRLKAFVDQQRPNFSEKQAAWLAWLIKGKLSASSKKAPPAHS
ncbi:MAG: hypothetical protein M0Z90_05490 [Desulfobacteraceae bacterium]|nr:hypothetical protein [Desulfobacteraceae bacterium]